MQLSLWQAANEFLDLSHIFQFNGRALKNRHPAFKGTPPAEQTSVARSE
jgi:hypothetical protein